MSGQFVKPKYSSVHLPRRSFSVHAGAPWSSGAGVGSGVVFLDESHEEEEEEVGLEVEEGAAAEGVDGEGAA